MFIPRHPVVENQFCKYGSSTSTNGTGGVVAYAGSVLYLDPAQDAIVTKMAHDITESPFGFSMQKVKTGYHAVHPVGMMLPGDLGSSDAIAQPIYDAAGNINGTDEVPVGVAHLGIWDTVHYTCLQTTTVGTVDAGEQPVSGQALFAAADEAKLTNSTVDSNGSDDNGERCSTITVAKVVKGVSAAKASASISNGTLYPIRVKLLV